MLKPRAVKTRTETLNFEYSGSKKIESIQVHQPLKLLKEYRRTRSQNTLMYYFPKNIFRSMVYMNIRSLRSLRICGVYMHFHYLERLLDANRNLRELYLNTTISRSEDITKLIPLLQRDCNQRRLHMKVTFENVRCAGFSGSISASEEQIRAWIEGRDDELLQKALSSFARYP